MAELEVVGHGGQFFDEMQIPTTSREFYQWVADGVERRKIEGVKYTFVEHKMGGIFSDRREYLRITWRDLVYDICAAPFGSGFFVSWWQQAPKDDPGLLTQMFGQAVGGFVRQLVKPETFYKADTLAMFKGVVSSAFDEAVRQIQERAASVVPAPIGAIPTSSSFYQ